MTWKKEHKDMTQKQYGGYCEMCRELKKEPVPYHKFDGYEYHRIYMIFKEHKHYKKNERPNI